MDFMRPKNIILCVAVSLIWYGGAGIGRKAAAQSSSSSAPATAESGAAALKLQRSVAVYNFKTTAEKGPLRGQEIYYFKCWICHNSYTIKGGTGAVPLKDLFKRPKLVITGEPVSDQTVAEKIKNGSPKMPAYRYTLSDADIADLLSYIRDEKCCFEGLVPLLNPFDRY